jgi:heavy metal response regulator
MRILLVEDEEKVARFVERGLVAERFAVDVAADGVSGLELADTYNYDLMILDLMLPRMEGSEVLRRVRLSNRNIPILVLTARDALADKVEHFEAGADDYLTKPFAFAELLVRVKALLRRGPVTRSSVLRVGDLELDRLSQQVKKAGKRVELTSKEYALLEYLMAHAGQVLSRTMIIEHVWDQSFDGVTNIVDVYVRHLRNKVDDTSEAKLIRTVRGVGYVIAAGETYT